MDKVMDFNGSSESKSALQRIEDPSIHQLPSIILRYRN